MSEPTDQILSAIAHELTGLVAANCCAKTGGRGGPAASKHCECRETALDVYRAAAPLIEAAVLANEREEIAGQARRYAGHYKEGSDGRNTFIMLAEWIEARADALERAAKAVDELDSHTLMGPPSDFE
jgi:hypothetical protein